MKNIKCPYCGEEDCIPGVAYNNAECYGSGYFSLCCKVCSGALKVCICRKVYCTNISATDFEEDDWGLVPSTTKSELENIERNEIITELKEIDLDTLSLDKLNHILDLTKEIKDVK